MGTMDDQAPHPTGVVRSLARWVASDKPVLEISEIHVQADAGFEGDPRGRGKRGLTLLSTRSWRDVCRDLGCDLPWWYRRANVLIEGIDLPATIGRTLTLGPIELLVMGETKPCGLMDQMHDGLRQALVPEGRGGVHGRVVKGGMLHVGDRVTLREHADGRQ